MTFFGLTSIRSRSNLEAGLDARQTPVFRPASRQDHAPPGACRQLVDRCAGTQRWPPGQNRHRRQQRQTGVRSGAARPEGLVGHRPPRCRPRLFSSTRIIGTACCAPAAAPRGRHRFTCSRRAAALALPHHFRFDFKRTDTCWIGMTPRLPPPRPLQRRCTCRR